MESVRLRTWEKKLLQLLLVLLRQAATSAAQMTKDWEVSRTLCSGSSSGGGSGDGGRDEDDAIEPA